MFNKKIPIEAYKAAANPDIFPGNKGYAVYKAICNKPLYYPLYKWAKKRFALSGNTNYFGTLKEELFNNKEKKILYLQGVLDKFYKEDIKACVFGVKWQADVFVRWANEVSGYLTSPERGILKQIIEYDNNFNEEKHTVYVSDATLNLINSWKVKGLSYFQ